MSIYSCACSDEIAGRSRSTVVVDSNNKYNTRGHVNLAMIYGEMLRPPSLYPRYLINLKEAFHRWTKINVKLDSPCRIDSPRFLEMPYIFLTTYDIFELTPLERENVKKFFQNGGFMVLDNARPTMGLSDQEASMKRLLFDALGDEARFRPIPLNHPIFHVFYDLIEGAPMGIHRGPLSFQKYYVTGVWVDNRLVAVLSNRGYTIFWNDTSNNEPHLRFGINTVIYALIYGGKNTDKD